MKRPLFAVCGCLPLLAIVLALFTAIAGAQVRSETPEPDTSPPARHIRFSGLDWIVKSSGAKGPVGPGPNFFSDAEDNVSVDDHGRLRLRISFRDGRWWCAEVICASEFGLGTYSARIAAGSIRRIDDISVFGFFNWSDAAAFSHREIDYELSRWGQKNNANSQFVVQPYDRNGHTARFDLSPSAPALLTFSWRRDSVAFRAVSEPGHLVRTFKVPDGVPPGGAPRFNLWLLGGQPPRGGTDVEVVVESFSFRAP
jgi:hypothetical protein